MINSINQSTSYKNNTCFKAIPLAEYGYLNNKAKNVVIYQLDKSNIGYMQHIAKNLDKFYKKYDIDNKSARQVIAEAFGAGIEILKGEKMPESKARILMAFCDNEPSSILIGNVLKIDKKGRIHYSSRKNHSKSETELDWLATWNKKFPNEGKATVYEYFYTLLKDGFKQCFVRSELPEKSSAVRFYKDMGFEELSETPRSILRNNDNRYVIGNFDDIADKIIPMKATVMDFINTIKEKADIVMRKEIKNTHSRSLPKEHFN